ncbi:MAG: DeoR/GlpR family DNA-binding transcription regulator [Clostridia bacterium]|nr:DeoR/GlpR family DNA-binding transcription regulator [Clostridia bacterium]
MLAEERRSRIMQLISEHGSAAVADLSETMNVSTMTIRRDIAYLASQGRVIKAHGGAVSARESTASEPGYEIKARVNVEEKRRIGLTAAGMVEDGETIVLDSGSTTFQIAALLRSKRDLTVVTNDLVIATSLSKTPSISVLLIGGSIRPGIFSTVGPYAEEMLRQLSVDKVFLGADAVDAAKGVMNSNPEEVPIKRLMMRAGHRVILAVDHSKFERIGLSFVCGVADLDMILTDKGIGDETLVGLRDTGVEVTVC